MGIQCGLKSRSNSQKVRLPLENLKCFFKLPKSLHPNAAPQALPGKMRLTLFQIFLQQEIAKGRRSTGGLQEVQEGLSVPVWLRCDLAMQPECFNSSPETHTKRQATQHDCLLRHGDKWIEIVEKNFLLGRLEKPSQDKNLLYRHDKLNTNQPRKDPFHLNSLGPHSAQFQQSVGATPHYSLSVPSTSLRRSSRWAWGLRKEKGEKNLYFRFKLCAKKLSFFLVDKLSSFMQETCARK